LPIPFSVAYGAHGSTAVGEGWDIPLSYVQDDRSLNHRRPALRDDVAPQPRERLSVVLPGRGRIEMVIKSSSVSGSVWTGRADGADLTMKPTLDGGWTVTDGAGRTYTFKTQVPGSGLFLLDSITAAGGGGVALTYSPVADVTSPSWTGVAKAIDLLSVR